MSLSESQTPPKFFAYLLGLSILSFGSFGLLRAADFQGSTHLLDFDFEPIRYAASTSTTAVDSVNQDLLRGQKSLTFTEDHGYLRAVLEAVNISPASQVLVYAKSSAQRDFIRPSNPRAIYFNDEVYVGYIPGAPVLELTASDPRLGTVFYTLDQDLKRDLAFERTNQCLECHAASRTMGVPGHLFRSFAVDSLGWVDFTKLGDQMTHRLAFGERFGGWYVSAAPNGDEHHGRILEPGRSSPFSSDAYLAKGSDLVALLVLGHQVHFHNFLTRLNFEARIAVEQYGHIRYLKQQIEGFLRYLLFIDEASLPHEIHTRSEYVNNFTARAKRDEQGRSLRDFDLKERVFRYRCSYLIGSPAFDALQPLVFQAIAQRLKGILESDEPKAPFDKLDRSERSAIRSILVQTQTRVAQTW